MSHSMWHVVACMRCLAQASGFSLGRQGTGPGGKVGSCGGQALKQLHWWLAFAELEVSGWGGGGWVSGRGRDVCQR